MSVQVWVLGDAVVDLLPDGNGRLLQCPGGAPANVAVGIARLGGSSGFIGRVGDDPFGRFMRRTLQEERVNTEFMRLDANQRTSTVVVDLDEHGERTFTFMVRPSADLFLEYDDIPSFSHGQWLHVCSIALSAEPSRSTTFSAMEQIKKAGGQVSFDPNIRPDLWHDVAELQACLTRALLLADVVKLSVEELIFISGKTHLHEGIKKLVSRFALRLLLVTQGKEGVLVYYHGQIYHFDARPVVCVDTTGAGDAFVAGLLSGLATRGLPDSEEALAGIIAQAQLCGALATTAKGAMTALPHREEVEQSL
ncbi:MULTISPECIES: aminoimidazole riboside kinase [Enterobacteriaceae]|uniref:aminoimidazole riboside kinase n=1 Tax=Enterobacteriaceae TaxID=543 RepID=UPI000272A4F4|nr:aminoimidazole riboside kinase [Enterobacter sp. Ag1]EJF30328.1 aminoimidazole riboside kinase [Enterobacter sp. Ag1]